MGMGYSACFADVIEESWIEEIAPLELAELLTAIENSDEDWSEVARQAEYEGFESEEIESLLEKLEEKFNSVTGLRLGLAYHDEDNGDRYDGISGVYWYVNGVYTYTEAGEKYKDKISRETFVEFG